MANNGGNSSSSHDHFWPSKMSDWHLKSPWDWEGCIGLYSTVGDRYERLPMAEWVCSEEGYNIGKELFRGTMTSWVRIPRRTSYNIRLLN